MKYFNTIHSTGKTWLVDKKPVQYMAIDGVELDPGSDSDELQAQTALANAEWDRFEIGKPTRSMKAAHSKTKTGKDETVRVDQASGHTMKKCRHCTEEYDASFFDGKCPHCDEKRHSLDGGYTYGRGLGRLKPPPKAKAKRGKSKPLTQESLNKGGR